MTQDGISDNKGGRFVITATFHADDAQKMLDAFQSGKFSEFQISDVRIAERHDVSELKETPKQVLGPWTQQQFEDYLRQSVNESRGQRK